jgi:hypothetical protein
MISYKDFLRKSISIIYFKIKMSQSVDPQFKNAIKEWYKCEMEEKNLKSKLSDIKKNKDGVESIIINYMQSNSIQDKDIHIGEHVLKYGETKSTEGITKKLILERLTEYFGGNQEEATKVTEFIYSNRNSSSKPVLKLNMNKN